MLIYGTYDQTNDTNNIPQNLAPQNPNPPLTLIPLPTQEPPADPFIHPSHNSIPVLSILSTITRMAIPTQILQYLEPMYNLCFLLDFCFEFLDGGSDCLQGAGGGIGVRLRGGVGWREDETRAN